MLIFIIFGLTTLAHLSNQLTHYQTQLTQLIPIKPN